jgi:hypothetical protein
VKWGRGRRITKASPILFLSPGGVLLFLRQAFLHLTYTQDVLSCLKDIKHELDSMKVGKKKDKDKVQDRAQM